MMKGRIAGWSFFHTRKIRPSVLWSNLMAASVWASGPGIRKQTFRPIVTASNSFSTNIHCEGSHVRSPSNPLMSRGNRPGQRQTTFAFFEPVRPPRAVQIMAYYGLHVSAPENSLAAIKGAYDYIEWARVTCD